jgi:DNA-binding CsgD family transcriptional regulator
MLHADGTIDHIDARGRAMLRAHGLRAERGPAGLPDALGEWVAAHLHGGGPSTLTMDGARGRLTARLLERRADGPGPLLLLEETLTQGPSMSALQRLGVTRRQAQVLALVVRGRSNAQIATDLSISRPTVRKHLEGIYAALGVHHRTAAAAVARDAAGL